MTHIWARALTLTLSTLLSKHRVLFHCGEVVVKVALTESMTDSMNSGIVFENVGLLWWLLLLRLLLLWARVAEALSSGRQLWSRGKAGAAC